MDPDLTVAQLTPSQQMQEKLELNQQAAKQAATAILKAGNDMRLRRALLRQHQAQQHTYSTGQQVFYWRDAPGGAGPEIRWKGPEDGRAGPLANIYWIAHGTTLLRASGEHLGPHLEQADQTEATPLSRAQQALDNIRGRSTTLYIDLNKTNKRKREEIATEDEGENNEDVSDLLETDMVPAQDDYWDISEDGITWTRAHVNTRQDPRAPWQQFRADHLTMVRRPPPHQRFVIRDGHQQQQRLDLSMDGRNNVHTQVNNNDNNPNNGWRHHHDPKHSHNQYNSSQRIATSNHHHWNRQPTWQHLTSNSRVTGNHPVSGHERQWAFDGTRSISTYNTTWHRQ